MTFPYNRAHYRARFYLHKTGAKTLAALKLLPYSPETSPANKTYDRKNGKAKLQNDSLQT